MRVAAVTRQRIVQHADQAFYENGYLPSSFAVIAERVGISRGNFHYHFSSKDEILAAVIEQRRADTDAMLARWEAETAAPADRIGRYIDIVITNLAPITEHGCPVGSLCAELAKTTHPMLEDAASIFEQFRVWLRGQFEALGAGDEADDHALHVVMRSQGIALLAQVYGDPAFVHREAQLLHKWLDSVIASLHSTNASEMKESLQ